MSRTSRCFAALFSQLGGPNALTAAEPFLYPRADFSFASIGLCFPAKFVSPTRAAKFGDFIFQVMNKLRTKPLAAAKRTELLATAKRSTHHNARGKVAAHSVAVG
jgi:hypothetical protein